MNHGYTGLSNLGNTCFLNACIQALNHTDELVEIRSKYTEHIHPERRESIILREYENLRDIMFSNSGVVTPNKFVHNVHEIAQEKGRELFTGWAQNDMPEFLLFIIECIHNSISREKQVIISGTKSHYKDVLAKECYEMMKTIYQKEYSEIMELFYGITISEIFSIDGNVRHSIKPEPYFILDIPIPVSRNHSTIYDCMDLFSEMEIIQGDNAWLNEKTNQKENIRKRITFWNFPRVLVISLKRFLPDGQRKNHSLVDFPLDSLDLSKYVSGYNASRYVYELYAVCNHMGGVQGGHYTAFARKQNRDWYHFNDSHVEKVVNPADVVSPAAYCLFYRKKNGLI